MLVTTKLLYVYTHINVCLWPKLASLNRVSSSESDIYHLIIKQVFTVTMGFCSHESSSDRV
jgi:hypothetical protein